MTDQLGIGQAVNDALPEVAKNPLTAWKKVEARLLGSYRQQFLSGGNGHWLPAQHETGGKLMMRSLSLYESATTFSDEQSAQINWGGGLAYGRLHQTGGTIPVTERSRKFFWFKFKETKDVFWKGMALTKKAFFSVPARPVGLTSADVQYIYDTLGTRDVKFITNYGASIIPQ